MPSEETRQTPRNGAATRPGGIGGQLTPQHLIAAATAGLLFLGVFYTLYFGSSFFLPIALTLLLNMVLSPVVRFLDGYGLPPSVGAAVVIMGVIAALAYGLYALAGPMERWITDLPQIIRTIDYKIDVLREPIETVRRAGDQVEQLTESQAPAGTREVIVKEQRFLDRVAGGLFPFLYGTGIVLALLYFLLASGNMFREKLVRVMPTFGDKRRAASIVKQIELSVSRYLFTVAAINLGLGAVIAAGLWALGLPNALLWGVMAAFLNFIPFLGLILGVGTVGLVALITFDSLVPALLAPAIYICANLIEAQLVTPVLLGRRFTMNPVAVFVSLAFWTWIWGAAGAVMAVPILVTLKVVCDHIEALSPVGEFLSGRAAVAQQSDEVARPAE